MRTFFRATAASVVLVTALSGCGVVSAIKAAHELATGNKALDNLTKQLQASENAKFDVTYVTTGSSPSTVEYAADPPSDYAFITPAQGGGSASEFIQNSSGAYSCTQGSGAGASWSCLKVAAQGTSYGAAFQVYTGAYWYGILDVYASVAALAGVSIKQTTMDVNGFHLQCVVITSSQSGSGNTTGTWCVTAQGLLGYAGESGQSSVTEIKSYSASPSPSLFQLPAGATVSTVPSGVTGGTTTPSVTGAGGSGASGASGAAGSTRSTGTSGTTGSTTGTGGTGGTGG